MTHNKNKEPQKTTVQAFLGSTITKAIAGIGTAIAMVFGVINAYNSVTNDFKGLIEANTIMVTKEIHQVKYEMAEVFRDDLAIRVRIKNRTILSMKEAGQKVPERMTIEIDALNDQIKEIEERWLNH